jgi:hypothetical protein
MTKQTVDYNVVAADAEANGNIMAVLEIDRERGVLYVHDASKGITALRICGLETGGMARRDLWKGTGPVLPIDITIRESDASVTYGVG